MFRFHLNWTEIRNTLHEGQYTILIISHLVLLRIRNISDKIYREYQNTNFRKSHSLWEIMWKNVAQPGRPQMTIRRICIGCWIPTATNSQNMQNGCTSASCCVMRTQPALLFSAVRRPRYAVLMDTARRRSRLERRSFDMLVWECDKFGQILRSLHHIFQSHCLCGKQNSAHVGQYIGN
jgi:hypothetical protein